MAAAEVYPGLGLAKLQVGFGYSGVGGPDGVSADALEAFRTPTNYYGTRSSELGLDQIAPLGPTDRLHLVQLPFPG